MLSACTNVLYGYLKLFQSLPDWLTGATLEKLKHPWDA